MLKHVVIRNLRLKRFKSRNTIQIFLLATVAIWLLYELKCSHKDAFDESTGSISQQALGVGHEVKFGRRGLQPWAKKTDLEIKIHGFSEDGKGSGDEEDREVEEESEVLEELIDEEDKEREEIEDHAVDELEKHPSSDHAPNETDDKP